MKQLNIQLLSAWLSVLNGVAAAQAVQFTVLVNFDDTNGASPMSGLTLGTDGHYYGTTYSGGGNAPGFGTVFKMTTNSTLTSLVSLDFHMGAYPTAGLAIGNEGNFYGTTYYSGTGGNGTVFRVTTNGILTPLVNFNDANGANPAAGLTVGTDGCFYGTTFAGGSNGLGTIFKLTPAGAFSSLLSFGETNGANPVAGLTLGCDGCFYGTTAGGGDGGCGTVFRLNTNGILTTLHAFTAGSYNASAYYANTDGAFPYGELTQGVDGVLYGTTSQGGSSGRGTIFKLTTQGSLTGIFCFNETVGGAGTNCNGASPYARLTLGNDGILYGTTYAGGNAGYGTVFAVTTSGTFTTLVHFVKTNGANPWGSMTLAKNGSFYGTTQYGGCYNYGTVFRLSLTNPYPFLLNINMSQGKAVLSWANSAFKLQTAPEVSGSYSNVLDATSPYTNSPTAGRKFFRLSQD